MFWSLQNLCRKLQETPPRLTGVNDEFNVSFVI
jgi:hypothetical protein